MTSDLVKSNSLTGEEAIGSRLGFVLVFFGSLRSGVSWSMSSPGFGRSNDRSRMGPGSAKTLKVHKRSCTFSNGHLQSSARGGSIVKGGK